MKNGATQPLMNLSEETKGLVNQGIFSLYRLASGAPAKAAYVLYAGDQTFLLSEDGSVVAKTESNKTYKVEVSVNFPELKTNSFGFGKYNIA